jgi:NADH-quinone oxidoreductase subunit L
MFWILFLSPLIGAILNGFILRSNRKILSHTVGCCCVGISFIVSVLFFLKVNSSAEKIIWTPFMWISAGDFNLAFEIVIDQLSSLMLLIITGIGSLIHIYAGGYMSEEKATYRFFSYLNLFIFMMLLLVCGNNFLVMFVGWEGVGLCSYLLIGYWFESEANASAGMKAFIVNRIGDLGFLIAMFLVYKNFSTLSFSELQALVVNGVSPQLMNTITLICLCLFVGVCGKSAQLPLYVWLPDAMAGPTPVSALIHAATMVTAGVYMMTRLNFIFYLSPMAMTIIACVGCLTAFFAATIALVQTDIKKVLAYSTVSQLGYMVLACGVGAFEAGMFHLTTHACFKALLFLGAGSVIVAMHHKQEIGEMGGLKDYMPITYKVFLIGVLAIIGIPGLSGFFSKDEILWRAFLFPKIGPFLWVMATITAALTAFYMVRLLCLTFYGKNRSDAHTRENIKETPAVMWAPLCVLAFLSIFIGYLGIPPVFGVTNLFAHFLEPIIYIPNEVADKWSFISAHHSHSLELGLMLCSTVVVFVAAFSAIKLYKDGFSLLAHKLKENFSTTHSLLLEKYQVDEFYEKTFVNNLKDVSYFLWKIVDIKIINGFINKLAMFFANLSGFFSFSINGSLQTYGLLMVLGTLYFVIFL